MYAHSLVRLLDLTCFRALLLFFSTGHLSSHKPEAKINTAPCPPPLFFASPPPFVSFVISQFFELRKTLYIPDCQLPFSPVNTAVIKPHSTTASTASKPLATIHSPTPARSPTPLQLTTVYVKMESAKDTLRQFIEHVPTCSRWGAHRLPNVKCLYLER